MPADFEPVFASLKTVLHKYEKRLSVKSDTSVEYTLLTKSPSPHPQHKGQPMYFGSVRWGKAYVSLHLVPLYRNEELTKTVPPELLKRMQGQACFNFRTVPEPELMGELKTVTAACFKDWSDRKLI